MNLIENQCEPHYKDLKQKYEHELIQIEQETKAITLESTREKLQKTIKNCWDEFESADSVPQKRAILQRFIETILIYKDKIEIIFFT
jgi:hypothetical protein